MLGRAATTASTKQATTTTGARVDTPTTYAMAATKTRRWFLCAAATCQHDDGAATANGTTDHATYHANDGTAYHATNDATNDAINLANDATSKHGATPRDAACLQHDWHKSFWAPFLTVRGG